MPPKPATATAPYPEVPFATPADFRAYLHANHATLPGLFVKMAKKASGVPSITHPEAVEVALCYGWIDSQGFSIDDVWRKIRFTPRRAKSIWSKKNVETVGRLIQEGLMRPAGLEQVEAAKKDGRWERAYAGPKTIVMPEDMRVKLEGRPEADRVFGTLGSTERYFTILRVEHAPLSTRGKWIDSVVESLAAGVVPGNATTKKMPSGAKTVTTSKVTKSVVSKKPAVAQLSKAKVKNIAPASVSQPRREGLRKRAMPE
jgi:uncharacterized protein YdeI (YjbR/CyaY-like superfamily)